MTGVPEQLAARVLDGAPDAVVICDPTGRVCYWNRGAERMFGFTRAEAIDASLDLIIPERLRQRHWKGWNTVTTSGETRYAEGELLAVPALHKDGRQISIEFSIQLLEDGNGDVEWLVAVIRDVTERYTRDKALRAALKTLQAQATGSPPGTATE